MSAAPLTLGTAGHVDHGKTRLVRALTGKDTDRLPEEHTRGLSIELGYAPLVLSDGRQVSLIDVPGHERFVRTMVAGATGIDLYLLVVDAHEGPRAQTHEHVAILRLLGIECGVVAVTRVDVAEPHAVVHTVELARQLVPGADVVPVSAVTGQGLPDLVAALERAASATAHRVRSGATRLYIDRVFSLRGVGTVVTGTLWSGTIATGDKLEVAPAGVAARVRSVQVHDQPVEQAEACQRVAVNLVAERRRRPRRGDALVTPGHYQASFRVDVALEELTSIADGARLQLCHGTAAIPCRLVRIGERYAQLLLDRPIVAARGDRLVLRAATTLGGGRILDPAPPRHRDPERMRLLEDPDPRTLLLGLVQSPVRLDALRARALLSEHELGEGVSALQRAGDWVFSSAWLAATSAHARAKLAERSAELDPGLPASALLGREPWATEVVPLLGLEHREGRLYLPGQRASLGTRQEAAQGLIRRLAEQGFEPLHVDDAQLALQLERQRELVRLGGGYVIGIAAYERAREAAVRECRRAGSISLARFRDLLGSSRRVAQLVLERLDSDRVTLRVGDRRRLRRRATNS